MGVGRRHAVVRQYLEEPAAILIPGVFQLLVVVSGLAYEREAAHSRAVGVDGEDQGGAGGDAAYDFVQLRPVLHQQ